MERISAFMDGESNPAEARQTISKLKQSDDYGDAWLTFHLIGDVMRGAPLMREDFADRFRARIEQEPTVLAPRLVAWRKPMNYALSAAASVAGVAVILTLVLTDNPLQPQPAVVASSPQPVLAVVAAPPAVLPQPVPAASRTLVNEYLMAHQEFSPSTTLQGVAPYVRTVSAQRDGNAR